MTSPLLIFDLDGTLLDTAPDLFAALNVAFKQEGIGQVRSDWVIGQFGHGGRALVLAGLAALGLEPDEARIQRLLAIFLDHYAAHLADLTRPFPGAIEAMDRLAAKGVRFAVCTNKRTDFARSVLDQLGLMPRFAAVVGGDHLPVKKPDPGHILGTIAAASGHKGHAVMVGDSDADIHAAQAAGVPVIGVRFGYSPVPVENFRPDAVIDHYDALEEALHQISPSFAARLSP